MKYGCQHGICFSPIDPCIFVEFFLIILGRFPRNVHTNCRNPPARSTTKKRKGRTIDLSYTFFPTRALTFSVKRDEFRYLVAVPSSSWRFLVRADRVPVLEEGRTTAAASAQTRHAEGGSAEHAGDGGHFQLRVVAQCRDKDILLYYAKSGQSSWVGILVGTNALSLVPHGTGGKEVQLVDPLRLINV